MSFSDFISNTSYANKRLSNMANSEMQNLSTTIPDNGNTVLQSASCMDNHNTQRLLDMAYFFEAHRQQVFERLGISVERMGRIDHPGAPSPHYPPQTP